MKINLKIIAFLLFYIPVFGSEEVAIYDARINLMELNELESYVLKNPEVSLEEIKNNHSELLNNINLVESESFIAPNVMKDMPLVGGFWWGCCLGVLGLALVYFITDKDKSQVRSALWGCLIFTVLGGGIYGFWNPFGW